MQLAHARFGDAHHRTDFAQVEVLFVVQAHQQLLALGKFLDRCYERVPEALVAQQFSGLAAVNDEVTLKVVVVIIEAAEIILREEQ